MSIAVRGDRTASTPPQRGRQSNRGVGPGQSKFAPRPPFLSRFPRFSRTQSRIVSTRKRRNAPQSHMQPTAEY
jgi:hypothetical protein